MKTKWLILVSTAFLINTFATAFVYAAPKHERVKYEYLTCSSTQLPNPGTMSFEKNNQILCENGTKDIPMTITMLGNDGWRLVSVLRESGIGYYWFAFMREK